MKANRAAHRRKQRRFVWMPMQRITVERPHTYEGVLSWLDGTPNDTHEVIRIMAIGTYGWRRMRVTRAGHYKPTGERRLL